MRFIDNLIKSLASSPAFLSFFGRKTPFFFLVLISFSAFSQQEQTRVVNTPGSYDLTANFPELKGTIQFQVINSTAMPLVPNDLDEKVKKIRHDTEERFIKISENVRVRVFPRSDILKEDYSPPDMELVFLVE